MKQHCSSDERIANEFTGEHGKPPTDRRGPSQYDALSDDQLRRVGRLAVVLDEACSMTLDGWIDEFCRDAAPESKIAFIEAAAAVYTRLVAQCDLDETDRKSLYATIIATTMITNVSELQDGLPAHVAETVGISGVCAMLVDAVGSRERP